MAIKPILFNTEMVGAILGGRKTCTRQTLTAMDGMPILGYGSLHLSHVKSQKMMKTKRWRENL